MAAAPQERKDESGDTKEETNERSDGTEQQQVARVPDLGNIPSKVMQKIRISNNDLIEKLLDEHLNVVRRMHEKEFAKFPDAQPLAKSVEKLSRDLVKARGFMRMCCQLVFELMTYKSASTEEDNKVWKAITKQSMTVISSTRAVFLKGVDFFGHLIRFQDSVVYCIRTQDAENPLPVDKSLQRFREDVAAFTVFANECKTVISQLDEACMDGIRQCLDHMPGYKSADFELLGKAEKEWREKKDWRIEELHRIAQEKEKAAEPYVQELKDLWADILNLETIIAQKEALISAYNSKLNHSEATQKSLQRQADQSADAYDDIYRRAAKASDKKTITTSYTSDWWIWKRQGSETQTVDTGEQTKLRKLADARKEVMEKQLKELETVQGKAEELEEKKGEEEALMKSKQVELSQKHEVVKNVVAEIQKIEKRFEKEEIEADNKVAEKKEAYDKAYKPILDACEETKVAQNNLGDFLKLFNCLVPCSQSMDQKMTEFQKNIENLDKFIKRKFAKKTESLKDLLTGRMEPFLECLKEEDIETLEDYRCESEAVWTEDFLPVFEDYAKDKGVKLSIGVRNKLRAIALSKDTATHNAALLDSLRPLPQFFYLMYEGLSRSCDQLTVEVYEDDTGDVRRALKQ